jgi:uroporphyrin-III C-methyltransferase
MGLSKLKEITEIFLKENKGTTAVALIQNGTLPSQKIALGTIETIVGISEKENIEAPAVIVIGEVVKQHREYSLSRVNSRYLFN